MMGKIFLRFSDFFSKKSHGHRTIYPDFRTISGSNRAKPCEIVRFFWSLWYYCADTTDMKIKYCNPVPVGKKRRYPAGWSRIRGAQLTLFPVCSVCNRLGEEVHHRDWNHYNNEPENLQTLCKVCHSEINRKGLTN